MLQHLPLRDPRETLREPREGSGISIAPVKAQETFWPVLALAVIPGPAGAHSDLDVSVELYQHKV